MTTNPGFHCWRHRARDDESLIVFPDGCRDVLIIRPKRGPVQILLTALDVRPRHAHLAAGDDVVGYRLRPGTTMSPAELEAIRRAPAQSQQILANASRSGTDAGDAIQLLSEPGITVARAARRHGVSLRTLQRHFISSDLPPPDFWRQLSRARRAAAMLGQSEPLAVIAGECGFSDQAHMSRDLRRWFSSTPAQLSRSPLALELLRQPALGNWTGEQISTR
ncbi:helix-turn-helix domain-containing protein [Mesorhizobium sp. ZMM04-5]|uniref:Helix-turn-helix domain-containing protein n=1 Tax=Mesorhizobium marinum TaxID=3228790 RepID=A0ABV3QWY1_9HYPH